MLAPARTDAGWFISRNAVNFVLATLVLAIAWPAVFSTFAPYDDEAYVMMTLQTYLQGHPLYGETHTQYGPAFYQLTAPLHSFVQWPLTHFGVRSKTVFVWLVSSLLALGIVRRCTRSKIAAVTTTLLVTLQLDKLALEPGHPQELGLLCTLAIMYLVVRQPSEITRSEILPGGISQKSHRDGWCVGALAATAGMIKLNCGLVTALPLIITAAAKSPAMGRSRQALPLLILLPTLVLAWMSSGDARMLVWTLWIGGAAMWLVWKATCAPTQVAICPHAQPWRVLTTTLAAGGLATFGYLVVAALHGSTAVDLWHGIVGQHSKFSQTFLKPIDLPVAAVLILGVMVLRAARLLPRQFLATNVLDEHVRLVAFAAVATSVAGHAGLPLLHGLEPRGAGQLLAWTIPGWLIWFWGSSVAESPTKLCLALIAVLSPWIAFPVSGTQLQIGTLPGLIVLGVCFGQYLESRCLVAKDAKPTAPAVLSMALVGLAACIATAGHWWRYADGTPLGLPGTACMRLPAWIVDEQQAIVAAIKTSQAPTLLIDGHGHNRFHFWTDKAPLTAANPTFWPRMLTPREQRNLREAIEKQTQLCVVRTPQRDALYGSNAAEVRALIDNNWRLLHTVGEWQIGQLQWDDSVSFD
ncbi:MAG: hypothetical protein R3C53_21540 [Pirellulaceae bacterium]